MIKPHYLFERLYELKRIELRMNEQQKYDVIKSLVDHNGNKKAAALKLGCTIRTINRLISKIQKTGEKCFHPWESWQKTCPCHLRCTH